LCSLRGLPTRPSGPYTAGLLAESDDIAARLASDDPHSARVKTLSVFALMTGTLQVFCALADQQLADELLEQGIQNALAVLGRRASELTGDRRPAD
jgi:TetR/AcrR family transcriptional regulator, transcriptional repressor for nem operon